MAFDSIQIGGTVSWIMEILSTGLIQPQDFNLPPISEMNFTFASRQENFDIVVDSRRNAEYAQKIIAMILFDEAGKPFRLGIRSAAKILDERYGLDIAGHRTLDLAVYNAHGRQGCMTPNQYWVPGMLSPMPMMGKYFVYYGGEFVNPRELGRRCVYRMVYELFSENSGVCRFHRKWVEAIVDEIISAHYDLNIDYKAHQFELCRDIYDHDGSGVVFWESERIFDMAAKFLEDWKARGLQDPVLNDWIERFHIDRNLAARDFWEEMRAGIAEAFQAGSEAIPAINPPYKAAKLDIMEKK